MLISELVNGKDYTLTSRTPCEAVEWERMYNSKTEESLEDRNTMELNNDRDNQSILMVAYKMC